MEGWMEIGKISGNKGMRINGSHMDEKREQYGKV